MLPAIGDQTPSAWLIVLLYAITAAQSWRASRVGPLGERRFWLGLVIILIALGVNKQLDLQTMLTQWGREIARADGWYRERRGVQLAFVAIFASVGAVAGLAMLIGFRKSPSSLWLAACGLCVQGAFVVTRAASMHHADAFFRNRLGGVKLLVLLEPIGIVMMLAGASLYLRRKR